MGSTLCIPLDACDTPHHHTTTPHHTTPHHTTPVDTPVCYSHAFQCCLHARAQIPLSAIGPTIVDIVKRTASWLEPEAPTRVMLLEARFELRLIEEALGGRRVGLAYAIRMLGFDETTKNGNPGITSNVIIEPTKGASLVPVLLRGAYCSAGGTSEAIVSAIEKKCFARLRDILTRWEAMFKKLFPDDTWTGPKPEALSMARLAGGGALQSDTCDGARKAKRLLAEMIAEQAREVMGADAWGKLTEAEQTEMTRVHELDCWQHLCATSS